MRRREINLRMMDGELIGVFGANGFIGRHLTRRIAAQGFNARAVSRRFHSEFVTEVSPTVEVVTADLNRPLETLSALQGVDVAIQLISTSSPGLGNSHIVADIEDNIIPHVEFLKSCIQAKVRKIIFVSSGGTVYGPGAPTPTPETAPTNPISSHGLTKLVVEKYIQMFASTDGIEYNILRLSNPYGQGQEFHKGQGLIPAVLEKYARGAPVEVYGTGNARRDYIYISDVVDAIVLAIPFSENGILNVGSGESRSIIEVLDEIERYLPSPLARRFITGRSTDVELSVLDITAARSKLNWHPKVPFSMGIARTVAESRRLPLVNRAPNSSP